MFGLVGIRRLGQMVLQNGKNISTVVVIGAGVMGHGIAKTAAMAGNKVLVYDLTTEFLNAAKKNIALMVDKSIKNKHNTLPYLTDQSQMREETREILNHITFTTDLDACFDNTELVIEAIFENLISKRRLFAQIENLADEKTIFGTNSATLEVHDIAKVSQRKDRILGIHFLFPVHKHDTLELVRLPETSELTMRAVSDWVWTLGKTPVIFRHRRSPMTSRAQEIIPPPPDIEGRNMYKDSIY